MSDPTIFPTRVSVFRRLWVVVLLTCLLIMMPVALVILLTGPVYRRTPEGYVPIGKTAHRLYASVLVVWVVLATLRVLLQPGGFSQEWANTADPDLKSAASQTASVQHAAPAADAKVTNVPNNANELPACNSQEVTEAVKGAIEGGAASVTVEDYGKVSQTFFDKQQTVRHCAAEAVLNTGETPVTFQIFLGPSGKQIVQAQTGDRAFMQGSVDEQMQADLQRQAANNAGDTGSNKHSTSGPQPTQTDADVRDQYSSEFLTCAANSQPIQEHAADMVKCINAEIDLQNVRFKQKFDSKMSTLSADEASTYRSRELAWADRMATDCKAQANANGAGYVIAEPRCVLNATIRHIREM